MVIAEIVSNQGSVLKGDGNDGKPDALRKSEIMIRGWSPPRAKKCMGIAFLWMVWVHI